MKAPRKPSLTDRLIIVAHLPKMQAVVKQVGKRITTYWIQHPSTGGECPLVFIGKKSTKIAKSFGENDIVSQAMAAATKTA